MKKIYKLLIIFYYSLYSVHSYSQPTILWQKSLGGTGDELSISIHGTSDGGYIAAGYSNSIDGDVTGNHSLNDYWIVKIDNLGILQWQKSLGGTMDDVANSVKQTTDGGYIVAGYSYSNDSDVTGNHGNRDYWVVKLDSFGTIQWQKSLGGTAFEFANSITISLSDGLGNTLPITLVFVNSLIPTNPGDAQVIKTCVVQTV